MSTHSATDVRLREALEASGQRFTEQRAAIFRYLAHTDVHPTADEVFLAVRKDLPALSLATVYKSLETLVGCGLAVKLSYADNSARYDGRTDPHHHARCVSCERVLDLPGEISSGEIEALRGTAGEFTVTGYRLELSGYCPACLPSKEPAVTA
ncbi:MAG: transcriptional repressor [Gemmatimonadota bacterium]|nr:transcriptional repressor [Gemmatimonadota bacterium]MDE3006653.1 transcriptional repressor [Gemmatimonadota bacterium]MDE3014724.1 transcriptional repressor [Gemmatimonadota bacterium]